MIMPTHYTTCITLQFTIIAAGSVNQLGNYLGANRGLQIIAGVVNNILRAIEQYTLLQVDGPE